MSATITSSSSISSELGALASLSVLLEQPPAKPSFFESCWSMLCCCSCTSPPIQGRQVTVQAPSTPRPLTPTPLPQSEPASQHDLLRDKRHVRALTRYAEDTYTSENVQFLQAVRGLSAKSNQAQIKEIIDVFIRDNAPSQVNISYRLRQQIVEAEYTVAHILLLEASVEVTDLIKGALVISGVRLTTYEDVYVS